ncbi:Serine/threonine-protein kinase pkn3 [Labilithrix luteola]|uniref:non-specific serine/threonine protein kinase n=1 Tax=Labilithrix luteola TaxID=1391654 RepID=A0A0K1Q466_9BACT|nr:serine/threonine-protein kinase [Labilithrix luteola]AKV00437.1 Serine/threonine-protein kinase pkn3 [Labilithrix luteola]
MSAAIPNPSEVPSVDRVGQLISGRYRVLSLIGEGGMGAVYLAEHTHMRKRFALKLLHAQMADNEEVLARFRREAEAAAHVEHPNIIAATDFGQTDDGAFFLVLEYVDGTTLRDKLEKGPFPAARALHVARQMAFALERAHDAGIVHRDLKPENVMLVAKGSDPDFVKVLDFGVARFDPPSGASAQFLTQVGTVMGTPSYMAPEQAVGDRVNHRADFYALGCVLYELLTGVVPFSGDVLELLTKHITAPVPPMSERAPGVVVPPPVEAVVRKLLEKDANDRYPTARALIEAIDLAATESGLDVPWGMPKSDRASVVHPAAVNPAAVVAFAATRLEASGARAMSPTAPPVAPRSALLAQPTAFVDRIALYRDKAVTALRPVVAQADAGIEMLAARVKLPKVAVLAIVGGVWGLSVLTIVVVLATRGSHKPSEGTVAKILSVSTTASAEEVRAAATKGPAALEELAAKYPKDAAVTRELAFAYDAAGRGSDALRVVRLMAEADPKGVPRELLRVVLRAASKLETADEAFRLLEGPLGPDGVDALIELSESKDVPSSTSSRAQRSLVKASVKANASPASAFLIDLEKATTCEDRHDVLLSAGRQADARALTALRELETKHGCGRRRRYDCNPCLRKDDSLARAIDAAQSGH